MAGMQIHPHEFLEITLALGGGGVKCYTQIGVLRALEQHGIRLKGLAGTSAGGIVATLYAAGYSPDEIQRFHEDLNMRQLLKRSRGERAGLFGLQRAKEAYRELLADRTFADLKIPLALTSVDLITGQAHLLTEGSVLDALMIAVAIPGLFPPTTRGGKVLLDGGALHPVPVAAARALSPSCPVVAVALFPPYETWHRHPFPNILHSVPLLRWVARWRLVEAFSMYVRAMDISQRMLAELRLERDKPDLIIRPPVDHLGLFDPVEIAEIARIGEMETHQCLPQIQSTSIKIPPTGLQYSITSPSYSIPNHVS
ncbi:MAG: hypothetical protein Fur0022_44750 [Anaerolineales bacterium]